jgi:uncharacterized repeat protein (TIGR01451 family)
MAFVPCAKPSTEKIVQSYPIRDARGDAIRLVKIAPKEVSANETFDYHIKVANLTDRALTNVTVRDCIPENLKIKSSVPKITRMKDNDAYWMLGTLETKASEVITITAVAEGKGPIASCADVFYDSPICAKINIVEPKLKLAKFAPSEMLMCDRIPVRYVVTNTGDGYACDVEIREGFQEGLMTAEGRNEIGFMIAALGPGRSQEFKTMLDANKIGRFASRATVTSRNSGTAESNMTETVISQPALTIAESGPESQYIGRSLTYDITVTNKGDGIAKNTVVEAIVPEGIRFDSATMGGRFSSLSPGKVCWALGTLEPNESRKLSMTLVGSQEGDLKTTVSAKAYCAKKVTAWAQTKLSGIPAMLLEVVDVSDPIEIGQSETYVITATNQGSATDVNIKISCILEEGMEYISSSGPSKALVEGNVISFAPLPMLAPKARAQWRVNVRATSTGDVRFKTTMTSDQLSRPVEETEATKFYK